MRLIATSLYASLLTGISVFCMGQPQSVDSRAIVFFDVTIIPMDRNVVLPHQTVIVEGDRIAQLGPASGTIPPLGATRIDSSGLFLMPGLVDCHVHLETALGARPNFGDGPLFLTAGVTTVINLRGSPEQLRWRSELEKGELIGPNLYTAGEFINEPSEKTPEEVEREVESQVREGYDLLKLHEIEDTSFNYLTTSGLSRPAYHQLIESARVHNIPLVGHIPTELGLPAALAEGQNLAHIVMYVEGYFVPINTKAFRRSMMVGIVGLLLVIGWCIGSLALWPVHRLRQKASQPQTASLLQQALFSVLLYSVTILLLSAVYASLEWLGDNRWIVAITAGGVLAMTIGGWVGIRMISAWKLASAWRMRIPIFVLCCGVALHSGSLLFFIPLSWRSTTFAMKKIAAQSKAAHIMVMTTLVVDHALDMATDPDMKLLSKTARKDWGVDDGSIARGPRLLQGMLGPHMQWFQEQLLHELHAQGVPLLLGTDTFGFAGVPPGTSVHKELELLQESGLSPYDALRTATVNPAVFLGKPKQFGSIAAGTRADLLLLKANPLADPRAIQPMGVMVRGRWLPRNELERMVHAAPK